MSASLVGSEMCIRDSSWTPSRASMPHLRFRLRERHLGECIGINKLQGAVQPVPGQVHRRSRIPGP
eukprot:14558205-Alexandrium_andersonii.AAC.1